MNYEEIYNAAFKDELEKISSGPEKVVKKAISIFKKVKKLKDPKRYNYDDNEFDGY